MNGTAANGGAAAAFGNTEGIDFSRAFDNNAGQSGKQEFSAAHNFVPFIVPFTEDGCGIE